MPWWVPSWLDRRSPLLWLFHWLRCSRLFLQYYRQKDHHGMFSGVGYLRIHHTGCWLWLGYNSVGGDNCLYGDLCSFIVDILLLGRNRLEPQTTKVLNPNSSIIHSGVNGDYRTVLCFRQLANRHNNNPNVSYGVNVRPICLIRRVNPNIFTEATSSYHPPLSEPYRIH